MRGMISTGDNGLYNNYADTKNKRGSLVALYHLGRTTDVGEGLGFMEWEV